jgi:hypothetical protein
MPVPHRLMPTTLCASARITATLTRVARLAPYLLVLAFLVAGKDSHGGSRHEAMSHLSDSEVKAAHVFKFKKYVEWPREVLPEGEPIVIGVVGAEDVAKALDHLALKRESGRRQVMVKRLQRGESLDGIHILYIGNDKSMELMEWLGYAEGKPILCVTDTDNSMPPGSMINFVQDNDRTRFDVSLTAAERSQIKLSAALLTVAREVYGAKL